MTGDVQVLTSVKQVSPGDEVKLSLQDGVITANVNEVKENFNG